MYFKSEKVLVSVHSWKLESVPSGSRLHYFSEIDKYSDCLLYITARQNILAWQIMVYQNTLQYTCIKCCRLLIQNIKLSVDCLLPVADSVADSKQTSSTNRQPATSCRLPIQIRNGQYKFNESATGNYCSCWLPLQWLIPYRKVTRIGNWQLVAGCRFIFEMDNISSTNRQPAISWSCLFPIRWTCLFRIGNWIGNRQLVASCRFVELILSVSNLNRLFGIGNWIGNWKCVADSLNLYCLFRIGNWIGNRQLNRQLASWVII